MAHQHRPAGAGRGTPLPGAMVRTAAREASPWIERLARLGYAARGVVYLLVGYIALRAALSPVGRGPTDSQGALRLLDQGSAGRILLAILALGLVGFALWRGVQAVLAPERTSSGAASWVRRIAHGISGLIHLGLALEAARLASRRPGDDSGDQTQDWTATVMQYDWGRWAVLGAGVVLIGAAGHQIVHAFSADFDKRLRFPSDAPNVRRNVIRLGRFGTASRGVVFGLMGWFLVQAALQYDSSEARGIGGALRTLQEQPYGPWLLGVVALGLIGFGIWQFAEARYRAIHPA